ncbi:hypothetical protein QUB16_29880 [Microcoleus sp. D3_18a_C4]
MNADTLMNGIGRDTAVPSPYSRLLYFMGLKTAIGLKSDATEMLHHSQLAVGAGSPTALKLANRFYKPARPPEKSSY